MLGRSQPVVPATDEVDAARQAAQTAVELASAVGDPWVLNQTVAHFASVAGAAPMTQT